ncbi:MAG: hypothetical protein ABEJ87_01900 [Candidatus Nanohalobium sp.]
MNLEFDLEQYPREIIVSTCLLTVLGAMQFLPDGSLNFLPFKGFFQGLFANTVGFVSFVFSVSRLHIKLGYSGYVLGFLMLMVVLSTFAYRKSSWIVHFLATATVALYGFLALIMAFLFPALVPDVQVLGLGVQVIFIGLAATELYKLLDSDDFEFEAFRSGYAAAVWQTVFGTAFLGFLQYVGDYQALGPVMTGVFVILGLLGIVMMFSAYELAINTRRGFYMSFGFLFLLFVAAIIAGSLLGVLVPFGLMILLWVNRKAYGVEYEFPDFESYLP